MQGYFFEDTDNGNLKYRECQEIARNWIDIKDDPGVFYEEIKKYIKEMEAYYEDPNMDNYNDKILTPPEETIILSDSTATDALITL